MYTTPRLSPGQGRHCQLIPAPSPAELGHLLWLDTPFYAGPQAATLNHWKMDTNWNPFVLPGLMSQRSFLTLAFLGGNDPFYLLTGND